MNRDKSRPVDGGEVDTWFAPRLFQRYFSPYRFHAIHMHRERKK
jgi:hypothetical protein